jgi:hypothetical protein
MAYSDSVSWKLASRLPSTWAPYFHHDLLVCTVRKVDGDFIIITAGTALRALSGGNQSSPGHLKARKVCQNFVVINKTVFPDTMTKSFLDTALLATGLYALSYKMPRLQPIVNHDVKKVAGEIDINLIIYRKQKAPRLKWCDLR